MLQIILKIKNDPQAVIKCYAQIKNDKNKQNSATLE